MKHTLLILFALFLCSSENEKSPYIQEVPSGIQTGDEKKLLSKILFARKKENDTGWAIYQTNADGTEESVLIPFKSGQGEYNPSISPDGKNVLFNTYRYGGWKLASFNIQKSTVNRFTKASDYFYNGTYSPNGKQNAYEKVGRGQKTKICIADSNGLNEKVITGNMQGGESRVPVWTPKGKSILFYSDAAGKNEIYKYNIAGQFINNLTNNKSGNDFNPAVSPDGKKVAFFSDREGYLDVFVMDINGQNQKCITTLFRNKDNEYNFYKDANLFWMFKLCWSPNGEHIVFNNTNSDNLDLFIVEKDGYDLRQLTKTPQSELTPVWGELQNK